MQADKLNKLKRLREMRRQSAERKYHQAARQSANAWQTHRDAEDNAAYVREHADEDRKSYLKSLFLGDLRRTNAHHSAAVAAYLRTDQQINYADKQIDAAAVEAVAADEITQIMRSELLKREHDERKLDSLMEKMRLDALRDDG